MAAREDSLVGADFLGQESETLDSGFSVAVNDRGISASEAK
jgi:hypothetical protein